MIRNTISSIRQTLSLDGFHSKNNSSYIILGKRCSHSWKLAPGRGNLHTHCVVLDAHKLSRWIIGKGLNLNLKHTLRLRVVQSSKNLKQMLVTSKILPSS